MTAPVRSWADFEAWAAEHPHDEVLEVTAADARALTASVIGRAAEDYDWPAGKGKVGLIVTELVRRWRGGRAEWREVRLRVVRGGYAASATLTVQGGEMAGAITVDTTIATVTLGFADDKGDPTNPPAGVDVPVFTSDDSAVLAVGAAAAGTDANGLGNFTAPLTPGTEGTANLGVDPLTVGGVPLTETDGTTPFPTPAPVSVTVSAGPAAEAVLTVNP